MTSTLYGHFCIEHVAGHHVNVATPKDPVTARFGQSFYGFVPRALFGSLFSAWRIQSLRLRRQGRAWWHVSNAFWRYAFEYVPRPIALAPPLWFRLMNPKVLNWRRRFWDEDLATSSLQPASSSASVTFAAKARD